MGLNPQESSTAVFGMSDGLVASLAIVLVASGGGRHIVLLALFGLLVAEGFGMAASQYLADPAVSVRKATIMGLSTAGSILLVGSPWLFVGGNLAELLSVGVGVGVASVVAWMRPQGWQAWAQTFAILVAVATIAAAAGRLG